MGWWKVQGTEDVVGDDAFSALRSAAARVAELYLREMGRKPSRSEWERLFADSVEPVSEATSMFREGGRPVKITIELEG